jgi:predicted SprT family Zn-dependent metalloprotease
MNLEDALELAWNKLDEFGLTEQSWTVGINESQRWLGVCFYDEKIISLSVKHVERSSRSYVLDTILHEIAHALLEPGHGHDWLWQATCRNIGGSGNPTGCNQTHLSNCVRR